MLVLRPTATGTTLLYIRPRSPRDTDEFFRNARYGELWIGRRHTLGRRRPSWASQTARPGRRWPQVLAELRAGPHPGAARLRPGGRRARSARTTRPRPAAARPRARHRRSSELRLVKDEWEIAQLQDAIDATVRGFEDVARVLPADRPVTERLIEGVFGLRARHDGNGVGYSSIVGAGAHATILHWIRNTGATRPGELLLMDMGVENRHLYTADVTRTVPVSGRFSPAPARGLRHRVRAPSRPAWTSITPGVQYEDVPPDLQCGCSPRACTTWSCCRCSRRRGDGQGVARVYRRWTLHGFGHMLGLDVHDCAAGPQGALPRRRARRGLRAHRRARACTSSPTTSWCRRSCAASASGSRTTCWSPPTGAAQPLGRPAAHRRRGRVLARRPARGRPPPARLIATGRITVVGLADSQRPAPATRRHHPRDRTRSLCSGPRTCRRRGQVSVMDVRS